MKIENYILIVLEGIDGAGKSTQADILAKTLRKKGKKVAVFKFPQYHQFFGRTVKKFLKGELGQLSSTNPYLISILYALNRFENKKKLLSLLKKNDIVLLHRYVTANLLYQCIHERLNKKRKVFCRWIERMEYTIFGVPKPDAVIYLHLPATLAYALIHKRGKTKELYEKQVSVLHKVNAFGKILAREKQWFVIPCNNGAKILSPKKVGGSVWQIVEKLI